MQSETNNKEKGFSVNKIYSTYIKISIIYLKKKKTLEYYTELTEIRTSKQLLFIYLDRYIRNYIYIGTVGKIPLSVPNFQDALKTKS